MANESCKIGYFGGCIDWSPWRAGKIRASVGVNLSSVVALFASYHAIFLLGLHVA